MIPSIYGVLLWIILVSLLTLDLIKVNVSLSAFLVFIYVIFCFGLSSIFAYRRYLFIDVRRIAFQIKDTKFDILLFYVSTLIGFFGLFLYIKDFAGFLGGFLVFFLTFFNDPLSIRALAAEETSLGFQLSYFSWLSIFYCLYYLLTNKISNRAGVIVVAILLFFEFFLNLMFVDRTRPVILFLICSLTLLFLKSSTIKSPLRMFFYVFIGPLVIFFTQAIFTEKYSKEDGLIDNFLVYVFGGFGYFSVVLDSVVPDYNFTRTFYPLAKMGNILGLSMTIPPQILDFKDVPFSTNVGTFLEPLLSDGGILFLLIATPFIIFMLDIMAFRAVVSRTIVGLLIWANTILVVVFSFFVPKYNSSYFYFFLFVYLLVFLMRIRIRR